MHKHKAEPASNILRNCGWLDSEIKVTGQTVAGDGNMNLVERVTLSSGERVILKRAHPWVEKYPDIPAPIERAAVEAAFYGAITGTEVAEAMPGHLGFSAHHAANLFEDMGVGQDGSTVYQTGRLEASELAAVATWLAKLHQLPRPQDPALENEAMRHLNAVHIFDFPLDIANEFDLEAITPGLQRAADRLKNDDLFIENVEKLKAIYLARPQGVLLHGDMYPASWLSTEKGICIIDPEFCWIGPAEWDLGILAAHLALAGLDSEVTELLYVSYGLPIDRTLANRFSGVEIMRRLIGVAQLPLSLDINRKTDLLDQAQKLVIAGA